MFIIRHRYWFFLLSTLLVLGSVAALAYFKLNLGTDFTGGTIVEVSYIGPKPSPLQIQESVAELGFKDISVQETGESGYIVRLETIDESGHGALVSKLSGLAATTTAFQEKRFSSVGPVLGQELAKKGLISLVIVIALILLYIAFVFRKVSQVGTPGQAGVSSWMYGLVSIVMMVHDAIIPTGIFALLGYYKGVEIDALFLTAFLTILGLSVNDKIVALDRIRENLARPRGGETFGETVGRSVTETLSRSINTSLTVILVLAAIFFYGAASTQYFALAMMLGMIVATYSSVFVAAPLLVEWEKLSRK